MQSFLGKINFLHKLISNYAYIVKPLQEMINEDEIYKWDKRENDAFIFINQEIIKALLLYTPNFKKYFLLYTYTFDSFLTSIATQKDDQDNEWPISFMSADLQGPELNYPVVNKQSYSVYKAVKHFRRYLLKNHVIIFVPHLAVRSLCGQ